MKTVRFPATVILDNEYYRYKEAFILSRFDVKMYYVLDKEQAGSVAGGVKQ